MKLVRGLRLGDILDFDWFCIIYNQKHISDRTHRSIKILVVRGTKIFYKDLSISNGGVVISMSKVY